MRKLLRPLVRAALRRDPREVDRAAGSFRIEDERDRTLVSRLGEAFIGGYNAMLDLPSLQQVADAGMEVDAHYRPFFFEGSAMGYLPRGYYSRECSARYAERDLLRMNPDFRYLYYVGLGFWYGFRHPRRPQRLRELAAHLDPLYFPLCYDGFGFKIGFFDYPNDPGALRLLERCPAEHRAYIHQGLGRATFFVHMDDPDGFEALRASLPVEHRANLETGRALGVGFAGLDRPRRLLRHAALARGDEELAARLTGLTWALTARRMNDPDYFASCASRAGEPDRELMRRLTEICDEARRQASDYGDWQARTGREAVALWRARRGTAQ